MCIRDSNYTNELTASRFSEVMWLMEQVMWKSLDKRVAAFLLEEASIEGSSCLLYTSDVYKRQASSDLVSMSASSTLRAPRICSSILWA